MQTKTLDSLLKDTFLIPGGFRQHQREVIERLLFNNKVLFIAKTGHGKSLCYQIPALLLEGMTLVFSPLRALMKDQNDKLNRLYKIPSAIVSSDFPQQDNKLTLDTAIEGKYKILFIAPERLENIDWLESVTKMRISMIVIDEAHCISVWGHDFRPFYRRLVSLIQKLPKDTPVLGLTATANLRVQNDILLQMGSTTKVYRGQMNRPNLLLKIVHVKNNDEKMAFILHYLQTVNGTGVVYTGTHDDTERLSRFLQSQNVSATFYHGGLDTDRRYFVQDQWMKNKVKVVCSTNALGMGIDKSDIRFIIHYQFPQSPIHYYQEIGRAGRDDKPSDCILLFNPDDKELPLHFIETAKPSPDKYEWLHNVIMLNKGISQSDLLMETGYSRNTIRQIVADLEEQGMIEFDPAEKLYYHSHKTRNELNLDQYETIRQLKLDELDAMIHYTDYKGCLSGYLSEYLGDPPGYHCEHCDNCNPSSRLNLPDKQWILNVKDFIKTDYPQIPEKKRCHLSGVALSFHGNTEIGKLVSFHKYKSHSPFPDLLVDESIKLLRQWYPMNQIDCILSIPSTKSGAIVEDFAKRISNKLGKPYLDELQRIRHTQPQKELKNYIQKQRNAKNAFSLHNPNSVYNKTILLIDDIYDSGQTMKEIGSVLMKSQAKAVYPFTITRTLHSDKD